MQWLILLFKSCENSMVGYNKNIKTFVGLAFIKDYKLFWEGFNFLSYSEPQISMGFKNLLKN